MAIRSIQTLTTAICLQVCVSSVSHSSQETHVWDKEVSQNLGWKYLQVTDSPKVIFNLHTSDLLRFSFSSY